MEKVNTSFRLSERVKADLTRLAEARHQSRAEVLETLILEAGEKLERKERLDALEAQVSDLCERLARIAEANEDR